MFSWPIRPSNTWPCLPFWPHLLLSPSHLLCSGHTDLIACSLSQRAGAGFWACALAVFSATGRIVGTRPLHGWVLLVFPASAQVSPPPRGLTWPPSLSTLSSSAYSVTLSCFLHSTFHYLKWSCSFICPFYFTKRCVKWEQGKCLFLFNTVSTELRTVLGHRKHLILDDWQSMAGWVDGCANKMQMHMAVWHSREVQNTELEGNRDMSSAHSEAEAAALFLLK